MIPMAFASSTSSSVSSSSKEKNNFNRLSRLLIDIGTRVFRDIFDYYHPPPTLQAFLSSHPVHTKLKGLRATRVVYAKQWEKLYPTTGHPVSSKDFDIALLFILLRNFCGLTAPPGTGWNDLPLATDTSLEADLVRIKVSRNELYAHSVEMALDDAMFASTWTTIEAALNRLVMSLYDSDIQQLKIQSMDSESEKFDHDLILSWEKSEEKTIDKINEVGAMITEKIEEGRKAEIAINGKVKVMTAGGLVAGWAAGSAYIISRYIDDPVNMVLLVTGAIVPATVATGLAVKKIIDGSFQIIVEVYSLDALDELWKSYNTEELQKKLQEVLVTEELKSLAPKDTEKVEICITMSEDDYERARTDLQQLETQIKQETYRSFCILPPKPSHVTFERATDVALLAEEMENLRKRCPDSVTGIFISGSLGCGKTELARQFGERYFEDMKRAEEPCFVATLNASSLQTLIDSYAKLARHLQCNDSSVDGIMSSELSQEDQLIQLQELIAPVEQAYCSSLIIIDNACNKWISQLIPAPGQQSPNRKRQILIITQNTDCIPTSCTYSYHMDMIGGMKPDEAVQLLDEVSGFSDDVHATLQIAQSLRWQPLALACAAVYMRQSRVTDTSFNWERYHQTFIRDSSDIGYVSTITAVMIAVEQSLDTIPVIHHTLQFLAVMAPEPIALHHVVMYVSRCMPSIDKESITKEIASSPLVLISTDGLVYVHGPVFIVLQELIQRQQCHFVFWDNVISIFSNLSGDEIEDIHSSTRPLVVHLVSLADKLHHYFNVFYRYESTSKKHIDMANTLYKVLSPVCNLHRQFDTSHTFLEITEHLLESHFGMNYPELVPLLISRAKVLKQLRKFNKARIILEKALSLAMVTFGEGHPYFVMALCELGLVLKDRKIELASRYANIGQALNELGEHNKAKTYFSMAYDTTVRTLGGNKEVIEYAEKGLSIDSQNEMEKAQGTLDDCINSCDNSDEFYPESQNYPRKRRRRRRKRQTLVKTEEKACQCDAENLDEINTVSVKSEKMPVENPADDEYLYMSRRHNIHLHI